MTKAELLDKITAREDFAELRAIVDSIDRDTNKDHANANYVIKKCCKTILNMDNVMTVDAVAMLEAAQRLVGAAEALVFAGAEAAAPIVEPGYVATEDTLEHAQTVGWGITHVCREALYAKEE